MTISTQGTEGARTMQGNAGAQMTQSTEGAHTPQTSASGTAMLSIRDLTKTYKGGKTAVSHLNLEIDSGDIYGFIGHNGAGKTTTLKAVAGILPFEEGEIRIDGRSVRDEAMACKERIAYIPDNPDLYEHLTGIQYLNFIGDIFRVGAAAREERIRRYAGEFEILDSLGDLVASYSHGMKQKLAVISALIHKPKLLILDEPFVGLDPKAALCLKQSMRELCGEGSAIFFSTHVLEVAEKLCDKIAIIKQGELVVSGRTGEVLKNGSLEELFMEVVEHDKTV